MGRFVFCAAPPPPCEGTVRQASVPRMAARSCSDGPVFGRYLSARHRASSRVRQAPQTWDSAITRVWGSSALYPSRGFVPCHDRHCDIHDDHVRLQFTGQIDCCAPVACLADDLQVRLCRNEDSQALSYDLVVIHKQHAQAQTRGRRTQHRGHRMGDGAPLRFLLVVVDRLDIRDSDEEGAAPARTLRILMRPPSSSARSRMLNNPTPAALRSVVGSNPALGRRLSATDARPDVAAAVGLGPPWHA